jgi:hypothetical protein
MIMVSKLTILAIAATAGLGGLCGQAAGSEALADDAGHPWDQARGGLAVNIFGFSVHADRSKQHNEVNPGVGLRYVFLQPETRWALHGETSVYYDSNYHWAKYVALGTSYRFADSWLAGAAVAYGQSRSYKQGKPFFALVPGVAYEYRRVAFNVVLLPSETAGVAGLAFFVTLPLGD